MFTTNVRVSMQHSRDVFCSYVIQSVPSALKCLLLKTPRWRFHYSLRVTSSIELYRGRTTLCASVVFNTKEIG